MQWFSDDPDNLISLDDLIWRILISLMIFIILIIDDNLYDLNCLDNLICMISTYDANNLDDFQLSRLW